ncbi:TGF-beta-activated kinase 1 and MAP3K7-binding protein 1-like [Argiope bruennichi]|uniref:TGF-beta-activated kinase 1 and MAP3K7-binding protein 1 n=1 Tax=Argiope bruennichi TaxID=94029 RepID=A0A8T0FUR1_ARGBR|nr:TGF-beta-activated kinase 1 and MAP3K7-binding protein 1-like [Argiope bruennichi]KAF8794847.1 TGF-beta-activated kinase 1 and MAP3K7-binding like protein [Argiope bruennichi]
MPTKAEFSSISSDMEALRLNYQEPSHSWTDDLPVCMLSGVGFSTNQKYKPNGFRSEEHPFEDRSFHFRYDENTYFYGVFDGHAGSKASDFSSQRMPAEILLGQLKGKESDEEVREVLHQAFLAVERSFFESIDDLLAEKENLRLQLQGLRTFEAIKQYPDIVQRLNAVTEEIQSGSTAVVALILKNKLYVANVGDSRAVLCTEDKNGKISFSQLSFDHTFSNEDELLRLSHLGLNVQKLTQQSKPGLQNCTRCIGNYTVKGGYKEFDNLSEAEDEPVIAEPNIVGGIKIDDKCKFLLLMSDGLYKCLEEATGTSNTNAMLVNMVLEQFSEQSTLNGVAQAVVDKAVRIHHDAYMRDTETPRCQKHDDITLLVRNFNCCLGNSVSTTSEPNPVLLANDTSKQNVSEHNTLSDIQSLDTSFEKTEYTDDVNPMTENDAISLTSSSDSASRQMLFQFSGNMSLDDEGRIKPYVDFSEFFVAVEEAYKNGLVPEEWLKSSS